MSKKGDALVTGEPGADGGGEEHSDTRAASELNGDLPFQDTEELRTLISQGRERGYLTFEEIASTLEEAEVSKEQVTELHSHLVEQGIDVIAADGVTAYKESKERGAWLQRSDPSRRVSNRSLTTSACAASWPPAPSAAT